VLYLIFTIFFGINVDEVGALVFDIGHYSFRGGYAGEDSPKTDIPTMVGVINELVENNSMDIDSNGHQNNLTQQKKYFIDTTSIHKPRKNMEITTFLKDGMSQTFIYLNYFYVKKV
jgi:actin-related protein